MKIRATLMLFLLASFTYILNAQDFTTTISISASDPTNTSPIPVTITFGASVSDFVEGEITVGNGTVTGSSFGEIAPNDGTTYGATITPSADGAVTVDVSAGVATNGGDQNLAATQLTVEYDDSNPTVAISTTASDPTNTSPIPVTFTFNEPVTGFAEGDITVGNGTVTASSLGEIAPNDGTTYSATIAPAADGTVTIDIGAGVAEDDATNGNDAATQLSLEYDGSNPTVTIGTIAPDPTNTSPIPVTFTFSEPVTGFAEGDITVGNGTVTASSLGEIAPNDGTTYSATITPAADGTVTVDVGAGVAEDDATNGNDAATQLTVEYNASNPTVAISSTASDPTNTSPIPVTFTFSEPVTGFAEGDITVGNGTVTASSLGEIAPNDGSTYSATITPAADGTVTVDVGAGVAEDDATNGNDAATQLTVEYNASNPTVAISSTASDPTNTSPIPVTFTFSEPVTGFAEGDITVGNGTVTASSLGEIAPNDGSTYSATITPAADGTVTVDVGAGVAEDDATNGNDAATQLTVEYDASNPTVAIITTASDPTNTSPIPVTFTFNEPVTGFAEGDITVGNGTVTASSLGEIAPNDGTTYSATITPSTDGTVTVDVGAGIAEDDATNGNEAATQRSLVYDTQGPTVVISSSAGDSTNVSPVPFTVQFSEEVSGFTLSDINVTATETSGTGGSTITKQNFVATDADTYTFDVAVTYNVATISVNISSNICEDAATNQNDAAIELSTIYDKSSPTVTISSTEADPTNATAIPVVVEFNEAVKDFVEGDLRFNNGSSLNFNQVNKSYYTFDLIPTADGVVTVDIDAGVCTDLPNNDNLAATQFSITSDQTKPTPTITSAASDPTNTGFEITVTFDESVGGFDNSDISVTNGTKSNFSTDIAGLEYTVDISPTAQGLVSVGIPVGIAADAAGNFNNAAVQLTRTFDDVGPTVTVNSSASTPTNLDVIPYTISFSEPVNGFTLDDITISGVGSASDFTGSGDSYAFNFSPSADGTISVSINAGVCSDAASNGNDASAAYSRVSDRTIPEINAVGIESDNNHPEFVGVGGAVTLTFTGSENLDMSSANVTIVGQPASVSGSGKNWTATYTMQAGDPTNVAFNIANYNDIAGNTGSSESVTTDGSTVTFDETAPSLTTVSILSDNSNDPSFAKPGDVVTINFTSDEGLENVTAKIGVEAKSMVVESSSATVWMAEYSLPGSGVSEGILPMSITFTDYAGNMVTHSSGTTDGTSVTFDKTVPSKPEDIILIDDEGLSTTDKITSNTNPELQCSAETGSTVEFFSNQEGSLGIANEIVPPGNYSIISGTTLSEGNHSITAAATDASGNVSAISLSLTITVDNTPPAKPGTPDMSAGSDTGIQDNDDITNDNTPSFGGTSETNCRIYIYSGATLLDSTDADIFGVWALTIPPLAEGDHSITVSSTDPAGNTSLSASDPLVITIDQTPPNPPTQPELDAGSDTGTPGDNYTSDITPKLGGTLAEAGSKVNLYSSIDGLVGTGTAGAGGDWTITASELSTGDHDIYVNATDRAGNTGANSASLSMTIDQTAPTEPGIPDLNAGYDSGISDIDNNTKLDVLEFNGTAEIGSLVKLYSGATYLGESTATGAGWTITTGVALTGGIHSITATATDGAGNTSVQSGALQLTVDLTAPVAPAKPDMDAGSDTGASSTDNITSDNRPTITGTAEVGTIIKLYAGATLIGDTVAVGGNWTKTLDNILADGIYDLVVTSTDVAGNVSSESEILKVTIDTEDPASPGIPDLASGSDSGISSNDDNTSDVTPTFTGSAEAGSTVSIYSDQDGNAGSTVADGSGNWTITTSSLTSASHEITVIATDTAGNSSLASSAMTLIVDTDLPNQPPTPNLIDTDDLGVSDEDNLTSVTNPTISGNAEANSYIYVYIDNTLASTQMVNSSGEYSFTFGTLADDTYSVRVICKDPAGNSSVTSDNLLLTIDSGSPSLPTVKISSDNEKSNYAKTGETITLNVTSSEEIKDPDITIDGKPTSLSGGPIIWTCTRTLDGTETQGELNFLVAFEDLAGNPGIDVNSSTDGSSVFFDKEAPTLSDISISSDHTNTDKARIGSEVNITFVASEEIENISVKINGKTAILDETIENHWTATGYLSSDDPEGTINFTIDYDDLAGNSGDPRTSTTDGTEVTFDKTLPTYTSVNIYSDNSNPAFAVDGNTVTLDFVTNEAIETPTIFINGLVPDEITGGPTNWSANRVISTGENEGVIPFSIDIKDLAGNTPAVKFSTTDGSTVTFDDTEPGISSVTVSAGVYTVGDVIPVIISADDVSYTGITVQVNAKNQTLINQMNNNYRIEYLVEEGDNELFEQGSFPVNIVLEDPAGLQTSRTSAAALNGTITLDASIPRISSITSNAELDDHAIIGDSIIFTLVPVDAETGLNIAPMSYNGRSLNWTSEDGSEYVGAYVVQEGDPEQTTPLQPGEVILYDDAGNADTLDYTSVAEKIFTKAPSAAITGSTTKCDYGQTVPVTFKFTGRKPYDLTYNNGSEIVGPIQVDASTYIANAEEGNFTLVSLVDSTGNFVTSATENASITVIDLPEITTDYTNSPYSIQSDPDELSQYVIQSDKRTGVFSGDGIGFANGAYYFYPDNIPVDLQDHDIELIYTYTDPVTGCFNKDTNTVFVSSTPVVIKNLDAVYCEYASTDILKGQLPEAHTGLFEIFDADSIPYTQGWVQNDSITLTLDPTGFEPGEYIIVYTALKYPELTITSYYDHRRFAVEASQTDIGFENLKTEYCFDPDNVGGIPINLDFDPETGSTSHFMTDDQTYFGFTGHTGVFRIRNAEAENSYDFAYAYESPNGCMSDTISQSIYINPVPELSFSLKDNYNFDNGNISLTGTPYLPENPDYYFTGPYVNDNQLKPDDSWVDREILITYHGTDVNGCTDEISHSTYIYKSAFDTIKGLNEDGIYCYSDEVIDLSVKFKDRDVIDESVLTGTFRSNHGALKDLGDNKAQYYIDSLGNGYDTIHFDYEINEIQYSIQRTIYVDSIGEAILVSSTDDFDFCAFETNIDLTSNIRLKGEDFFEFNGLSIDTSTTNDQFTFDPAALLPDQTYTVDYTFTSENNCKVSTSEVITIYPVPDVDFTQPEQCFLADEDIQFTNLTTFEEGDIQDISWKWSLEGAIYTPRDVVYAFKGEGPKTVVLTATTRDNCSVSSSEIITIGNTANADFKWNIECLGDSIQFENRSTGGNVDNGAYKWFVDDDPVSDDMNLKYLFKQTGSYDIKLDFVSTDNCKDSKTKSLFLQPMVRIKEELEDGFYLEDFEGINSYDLWSHRPTEEMLQDEDPENDNSRWSLGDPDGAIINYPASGDNAWFTNINDISVVEQSEVVSPCFDFTGLDKPMIKMDIWSSSEFPRDGATLQYSTDQGVSWNYLGNQGEGINWFNSNNVLSFNLGAELVRGWNQEPMTNWRSARHNLDALAGQPNVRFRIVYAADGNNAYPVDGFAFDNVFIGDRQQQVLSEYFTNVESDSYEEGKAQVNALFAAKDHDIVSINYHTGDSEEDPMYKEYKEGPSARVYYYGITNVPYIIANGSIRSGITSDAEQTSLESKVDIESLKDPKLAINATLTSTKGDFTITAKDDMEGTKLFLFLAVVKDSVVSGNKVYYNILRDFLPDPSGVKIESSGFVAGKSINKTVSFSNVDKARFIGSSLVVFVQNAETKEVYQVVTYDLDNVLDGIWEHSIADVDVYPNPASNIIFIDSEAEIEDLVIIDLMGRVVTHIKPGLSRISVPIEDLKDGIYFIRGKTTRGEFIEKVVVR